MRIARVELYALELPFAEPFILSGGRIDARRSVVVVLHDGEGHVGYGESAPDELPFYSEETLGSARDLIPRVLAPRIAGQEFDSPEAVDAALRENVRGNPFARAGIETAAWGYRSWLPNASASRRQRVSLAAWRSAFPKIAVLRP